MQYYYPIEKFLFEKGHENLLTVINDHDFNNEQLYLFESFNVEINVMSFDKAVRIYTIQEISGEKYKLDREEFLLKILHYLLNVQLLREIDSNLPTAISELTEFRNTLIKRVQKYYEYLEQNEGVLTESEKINFQLELCRFAENCYKRNVIDQPIDFGKDSICNKPIGNIFIKGFERGKNVNDGNFNRIYEGLYNYLVSERLIADCGRGTFFNVFNSHKTTKQIQWLGTKSLLAFFIISLNSRSFITDKNYYQLAATLFQVKGQSISSRELKNAPKNLKINGADKLEQLLVSLI